MGRDAYELCVLTVQQYEITQLQLKSIFHITLC